MRIPVRLCLLSRFLLVTGVLLSFGLSTASEADANENSWQTCSLLLAPSSMGWSVYAARDFKADEIIEISPMFLPVPDMAVVAKNSILDDYTYGYIRRDKESGEDMYHHQVLFGMGMFYNHHPTPNARISILGEKTKAHVAGFMAIRDIEAGEEIFSTYGHLDGGKEWFEQRGLVMQEPEGSWIGTGDLEIFKTEFCSKVYAGAGLATMQATTKFQGDLSHFAPFDAGIGDARAKTNIAQGERIDITIGLPLSKDKKHGTLFGAVAIDFDDLDAESQKNLMLLRHSGHLSIVYRGHDTSWAKTDEFTSFENLTLLPVGGNIGMVRRVGDDPTSNCRLHISWQGSNRGSDGVLLELFATKDIAAGDVLKLQLQPPEEGYDLLHAELDEQGGHPYSPSLFQSTNEL